MRLAPFYLPQAQHRKTAPSAGPLKKTKTHSNHFEWGYFLTVYSTFQIASLPFLKLTLPQNSRKHQQRQE